MAVWENDVTDFLHLVLFGREPDLAGRKELFDRLVVALFRGQHELLVRADDAVVERCAGDDLLGGVRQIDVAIDDDRHVAGADAVRRLSRGVGGLHHGAAAGRDNDIRRLHERLRGLDGTVGDHLDEVLGGAMLLQDFPVGPRQVARGRLGLGMRREDHRVAGLEREHGVALGVTMGFVTGHTAATTPIGFATIMRFASSSSPMMPRDFLPLRLFQMTRALPLAFATLSSYTPRPVSLCAAEAMVSALS